MEQRLKRTRKKVSKPSYETWLKSTTAHNLKKDVLTITAPNEFARLARISLFRANFRNTL